MKEFREVKQKENNQKNQNSIYDNIEIDDIKKEKGPLIRYPLAKIT